MNKVMTGIGAIVMSISIVVPAAHASTQSIDNPSFAPSTKVDKSSREIIASPTTTILAAAEKFRDLPEHHWAYESVQEAVDRGYVDGYTDGTFKPDKAVTRAEFIKMLVAAINLRVADESSLWYASYVEAAIQAGIIKEDEYSYGDYNTPMTRKEMARVAVRAIDQESENDDELMYIATSLGLIQGLGHGRLAPNETTTRAQAVTIIERVLTVIRGETLPVDEDAVERAQQELHAARDPWGRKVRTTDLPNHADLFPYILADVPNEMYELEVRNRSRRDRFPKEMFSWREFTKERLDQMVDHVEGYYDHILNIDYATIDDAWAQRTHSLLGRSGASRVAWEVDYPRYLKEYVDFVRRNKIKARGKVKVEPSMIYEDVEYWVRSYFEIEILSMEPGAIEELEDAVHHGVFWAQTMGEEVLTEVGVVYRGYADLPLSVNLDKSDTLVENFTPGRRTTLFRHFVMVE